MIQDTGQIRLSFLQSGKNNVSSQFFDLSDHADRKSGSLKRFRAGEKGEGSAEVWDASRHKPLTVKKLYQALFPLLASMRWSRSGNIVILRRRMPFMYAIAVP